jgi:radical SAM superfamily enzyme YgiQ (UPF0313 family)
MKTLLISANRNLQPVPVLPFGACIVAEAAEKAVHSVELLDLMFEKNPLDLVERKLRDMRPDVVGLSVRNIDNNDLLHPQMFYRELRSITDTVRKESKAEIVLGGAAVTIMPEQLLRYSGASFAVPGNGEIVFPEILSALEQGKDPRMVGGVGWLDSDKYKESGPAKPDSSDSCIAPDFHRWLDMRSYLSGSAAIPIQTKRGCPFECVYCTYAKSEGREYRLFNRESVVETIRKYLARGWRDIEFVDNVFNSPREQAIELCRLIKASGMKARLQSMELNPKFIDDNLISAMEGAGFVGMGITAESASDKVLEKLGKNYTARDMFDAASVVRKHRIPCFWIFMLGGPGETRETVEETIAFAEKCLRRCDTAFFNLGVRIYPGTHLEKIAQMEGVIRSSGDEMLDPVFYISPQIDAPWLIQTLKRAVKRNMRFISQDTFALPWLPRLMSTLRKAGVHQPLWRHTGSLRRTLRFLGVEA